MSFLQVTVEYCIKDGCAVPVRVHTIVISVQHSEDVSMEDLKADLHTKVIKVSLLVLDAFSIKGILHETKKMFLCCLRVKYCVYYTLACSELEMHKIFIQIK